MVRPWIVHCKWLGIPLCLYAAGWFEITLPIVLPVRGGWADWQRDGFRFGYTFMRLNNSVWCLVALRIRVGRFR